MLEYYKAVLGNVTFDTMLFRKELRKAMRELIADDRVRAVTSEKLNNLNEFY